MEFGGWVSLECPTVDPRWLAVKDCRVPPVEDVTDAASALTYCRTHLRYRADVVDEWSKPGDTLARGYGDCEDWSIAARALLLAAGFPDEKLWLIVARDLIVRIDHAFLIAGDDVLDNRSHKLIPLVRLSDYRPVYGFSGDRQYLFGRKR